MKKMFGEIKLIPYDGVPVGWIKCKRRSLHINKYPKLYMLLGTNFGNEGEFQFRLPNLTEATPKELTYCIATVGELPKIHGGREEKKCTIFQKKQLS